MSKKNIKTDLFDKRIINLGILYFLSATGFILTLFLSKWILIFTAPLFFYLGAMSRGYNRIKGMYRVIETNKIVKDIKKNV